MVCAKPELLLPLPLARGVYFYSQHHQLIPQPGCLGDGDLLWALSPSAFTAWLRVGGKTLFIGKMPQEFFQGGEGRPGREDPFGILLDSPASWTKG